LRLTLETREVGRVAIVRCKGRIVAGGEAEFLGTHIENLLPLHRAVVLQLSEVDFIDSSGLGAMVRSRTRARQTHGDVGLCCVPAPILRVLQMTHLDQLFDISASEELAVVACSRLTASFEKLKIHGPSILCIHNSLDVLAYLRELLRRTGYQAYTSNNLHDSLFVLRLTPPALLLLGSGLNAPAETEQAFRAACGKIPVMELGKDFCTEDPCEAAAALLGKIAARLKPSVASV